MRVIHTCTFSMSTKTPYSEFPAIARRFLEEQNLVAHRFMYYFDEMICLKSYEETLATGGCAKAVKDCPALGSIRYINVESTAHELFLTNIDKDTGCTEADILPHMNKIHRRYGFRESDLYYYDIDFFGHVIPFEREMSFVKLKSEYLQREVDPALLIYDQLRGSGIRLHRYSTGGNYISLSIDILHNGIIYDAKPYFDAMKALLPNKNPWVKMDIYLSEAEKQEIASWDKQIAPILEEARSFLAERFPSKDGPYNNPVYRLAPTLKKLAKQYGYAYKYEGNGFYSIDKRMPRGHILRLWVDSGPSHFNTTYGVIMEGVGFCHRIYFSEHVPRNQAESDACSEAFFSVAAEFEKAFIPKLDAFYEETPDWFVASFC